MLKRCVLRLRLKLTRVFVDLTDSARLFQTGKRKRSSNLVHCSELFVPLCKPNKCSFRYRYPVSKTNYLGLQTNFDNLLIISPILSSDHTVHHLLHYHFRHPPLFHSRLKAHLFRKYSPVVSPAIFRFLGHRGTARRCVFFCFLCARLSCLIETFRFAEDRTTWRSILGLSERVHTSP